VVASFYRSGAWWPDERFGLGLSAHLEFTMAESSFHEVTDFLYIGDKVCKDQGGKTC
jgi:hypothetical protein